MPIVFIDVFYPTVDRITENVMRLRYPVLQNNCGVSVMSIFVTGTFIQMNQ